MRTPSRLSGGICVFLTLSVFISSTSLILAACETTIPQSTSNTETTTVTKMEWSFVPGEVLVKFKPSVSTEKIDTILKEAKTELIAQLKGAGVYHVRIFSEESVESVAKKLSSQPEVEYAEPNLLYQQFK